MGLYFLQSHPVLGALGLLGGVFHMLNHSLYKSCLFLGAGSVFYRTGSRNLAGIAGLRAAMPVTAMCALAAALAIAGVPPFNGFASKWLMYATAILGGRTEPLFVVLGIVAMFISLVTLASFLKYLGGAFFGPPPGHPELREVPTSMLVPQVTLALLCIVFGLVPGWPLQFLHRALAELAPDAHLPGLAALLGGGATALSIGSPALGAWAPLPVTLAVAALALVAYFGLQRAAGAEVRDVSVWECGEEASTSITRYPATSYYQAFKKAFHGIYPNIAVQAPAFPPWLRRAFDLDRWLYLPIGRAVDRGARGFSRTHVGIPQIYLLWIVVGAIAVTGVMLAFLR
jgi:hydrogenase-4 component B